MLNGTFLGISYLNLPRNFVPQLAPHDQRCQFPPSQAVTEKNVIAVFAAMSVFRNPRIKMEPVFHK